MEYVERDRKSATQGIPEKTRIDNSIIIISILFYLDLATKASSSDSKFDSRAAKEQLEKLMAQRQIHDAKECKRFYHSS